MKKINDNNFDIGLKEETRFFICNQLSILLSDKYLFFTKLLKYHWNIRGQNFKSLHVLFEDGYNMLLKNYDLVAERILQLGYEAPGTMVEFLKLTRLSENPGINPSDKEMIDILCKDIQSIIIQTRELINNTDTTYRDVTTSNLLTDFLVEYEKYLWILRSHII